MEKENRRGLREGEEALLEIAFLGLTEIDVPALINGGKRLCSHIFLSLSSRERIRKISCDYDFQSRRHLDVPLLER